MALTKDGREAIIKAAEEEKRLKELKFSESLGRVTFGGKTYTDDYYALKNLKKDKK